MAVSWTGQGAVSESVLLMLAPLGSGLKLGPLPEGHCMLVVLWTLVENTVFYVFSAQRVLSNSYWVNSELH